MRPETRTADPHSTSPGAGSPLRCAPVGMAKGKVGRVCFCRYRLLVERTADPSASLGMTKGRGRFHLYLMLDEKTAGPSTSLRSGRDDNSYFGKRCERPRKRRKKSQTLGMTKDGVVFPPSPLSSRPERSAVERVAVILLSEKAGSIQHGHDLLPAGSQLGCRMEQIFGAHGIRVVTRGVSEATHIEGCNEPHNLLCECPRVGKRVRSLKQEPGCRSEIRMLP